MSVWPSGDCAEQAAGPAGPLRAGQPVRQARHHHHGDADLHAQAQGPPHKETMKLLSTYSMGFMC